MTFSVLPCPSCDSGFCTTTERLGSPDVGEGQLVRCPECNGENVTPCFICGSPATDHTAEGPACAACAPCCLPLDPEAIERGRQERDTRPPTEVRDTERVPGCWAADAAGR